MVLCRAVAAALLLSSVSALAQEKGLWRATSTTARGVTGDVAFGDEKLSINFQSFTAAELRSLSPAELAATFNTPGATGAGHLFRVSIPGDHKFLHKNTLCGSEETQYLVSWVQGRTLQLAFFSGSAMPSLTPEAVANTTTLCGTYTYTR